MNERELAAAILDTLAPGRFLIAAGHSVRLEHINSETIPWEIYLGHLISDKRTWYEETFASWHLFLDRSTGPGEHPLVSVRWSETDRRLYVTRAILTYVHEPYEEEPNVILTRETTRWVPELVGSLFPGELPQRARFSAALSACLERAFRGTSRLPITSLESPLPDTALGNIAYLPWIDPASDAISDPQEAILRLPPTASPAAMSRLWEAVLRHGEHPRLDQWLWSHWDDDAQARQQVPDICRRIFGQLALSPYTGHAERLVDLIEAFAVPARLGIATSLKLLSYMLRHLARHLTAFDLVQFHNEGANYPDALFLDALLRVFVRLAEQAPERMLEPTQSGRLLRRALRSGWLARNQYQGHAVPDLPTSPGANQRVMPPPYERVPEEQLPFTGRRSRKLFADTPTSALFTSGVQEALEMAAREALLPEEIVDAGTGLYLDRPLGMPKEANEVDRTVMLSYEVYDQFAGRRIGASFKILGQEHKQRYFAALNDFQPPQPLGFPRQDDPWLVRQGVVCLPHNVDSSNKCFIRSTRSSLDRLFTHYDLIPLEQIDPQLAAWLKTSRNILLIRTGKTTTGGVALDAYDEKQRLRASFATPATPNYQERGGVEFIAEGLQVTAIRDENDETRALENVFLPPRLEAVWEDL